MVVKEGLNLVNKKTMAYSPENQLKKIIHVQEIYLEHSRRGVSGEYIFHKYIQPQFYISRATFYNYLSRNAKRELKRISEAEH